MSINTCVRWGIDLTLVAVVLAAVRRSTGLVLRYETMGFSGWIHGYLQWGEVCLGYIQGAVRRSKWFRPQVQYDGFPKIEELD